MKETRTRCVKRQLGAARIYVYYLDLYIILGLSDLYNIIFTISGRIYYTNLMFLENRFFQVNFVDRTVHYFLQKKIPFFKIKTKFKVD